MLDYQSSDSTSNNYYCLDRDEVLQWEQPMQARRDTYANRAAYRSTRREKNINNTH